MKRYIQSSKLTSSAKANGEMAVRSMNQAAQIYYDVTDPLTVWEYEDTIFPDNYDYEDDEPESTTLYAIDDCGNFEDGLTFDELEEYLTECYNLYLADSYRH